MRQMRDGGGEREEPDSWRERDTWVVEMVGGCERDGDVMKES